MNNLAPNQRKRDREEKGDQDAPKTEPNAFKRRLVPVYNANGH